MEHLSCIKCAIWADDRLLTAGALVRQEGAPVPANRSRTTEWRRCLQELAQRQGALEIAVARNYQEGEGGQHLVWRVRLLRLTDEAMIVEEPMALGQTIKLEQGIQLVAILAIGQNRWMFNTANLGETNYKPDSHTTVPAIRLSLPVSVERCQRRNYYRVETASLTLPQIDVWPLLDPKSVLVAERVNELEFEAAHPGVEDPDAAQLNALDPNSLMPDVGPKQVATLLNLGGGGIGLRFRPEDSQILSRHKLFWLCFQLPPELETPICATAKLIHTHMELSQDTYAGMAFDFSFNPSHQRFVVNQICRYIAIQQQAQFEHDDVKQRKSA